ncbi:MAG: 16S rRNA (cytosine(967)-C(5))-methyltransferase RsmB, partial [Deltaproteobacteria bacterium]
MARGRKAISPARRIALEVLRRVEAEGAYVNICLNHSLERHPNLAARDRALATELVYGTLRWRRRLDWALAAHCRRPPDKIEPKLLRILRMGAYQLLMLDGISDWAAVDQAVELASVMRGRRAGGFVNGVLRALARGKAALEWPSENEDPVRHLGVMYSFPDWLVELWMERFGRDGAEQLMKALNQPASTWLRVNTLRITTDALAELLLASGVDARSSGNVPQSLECHASGNLAAHAAHQSGLFHIQDGAAQLVCHLLDARPGMRVLDACAAPGGKTATVAELMENRGELLAADINPARLSLV